MSDILEDTRVNKSHTDDGDHDKFQHYFWKSAIEANLLTGKPMVALCGKIVSRQVDPKGRTVCQKCEDELEKVVSRPIFS